MAQRRRSGLLVLGLVLIAVGLLGALVTGVGLTIANWYAASSAPTRSGTSANPFSSNGERIYFTGVGHTGPIVVEWGGGMMGGRRGRGRPAIGCTQCHGSDGRGGMIGMMTTLKVPDVRYETLTRAHRNDEGGVSSGWTDEDIARAIRQGVEPDGERLELLMPRWQMDSRDMTDTIEYLKELDGR